MYVYRKGSSAYKGFTLVELLIVIIIVASLAVAVFVALNPVKRLQDARDTRRQTDVESILRAIHQYLIDNGKLPDTLLPDGVERQIGTGNAAQCSPVTSGSCNIAPDTACVDLSVPLASYLKTIPIDPVSGSAIATGYTVSATSSDLVTVNACGTED